MNSDSIQIRMLHSSLVLVGALVFFINSLHSRPDDGQYARQLYRAIFPLTVDGRSPDRLVRSRNQDEEAGIPYAIGGVMYLRDIVLKPWGTTYRFSEMAVLQDDVFQHAVGCLPEDINRWLFQAGIHRLSRLVGYVPQRKGYTRRRQGKEDEDLERQFPQLEGVVDKVVAETDEGLFGPSEDVRIGDVLEKILQQYASDIMQKVGNPRKQAPVVSYCLLVQYDRQQLGIDDINTLNLGPLFAQVQWRRATRQEWREAFNRMFPPVDHVDSYSTSHFRGCRYYHTFRDLLLKLDPQRGLFVRNLLKRKIAELAWIPAPKSDRLWDYTLGDGSWAKGPFPDECGPRILVNPRSGGQVNIKNTISDDVEVLYKLEAEAEKARNALLREEEEEESDEETAPQRHVPTRDRGTPDYNGRPAWMRPIIELYRAAELRKQAQDIDDNYPRQPSPSKDIDMDSNGWSPPPGILPRHPSQSNHSSPPAGEGDYYDDIDPPSHFEPDGVLPQGEEDELRYHQFERDRTSPGQWQFDMEEGDDIDPRSHFEPDRLESPEHMEWYGVSERDSLSPAGQGQFDDEDDDIHPHYRSDGLSQSTHLRVEEQEDDDDMYE